MLDELIYKRQGHATLLLGRKVSSMALKNQVARIICRVSTAIDAQGLQPSCAIRNYTTSNAIIINHPQNSTTRSVKLLAYSYKLRFSDELKEVIPKDSSTSIVFTRRKIGVEVFIDEETDE